MLDSQIVLLNKSRERAKYWKEDDKGNWIETGFLPADALSIQYYFSKGFKSKPPEQVGDNGNSVKCPIQDCEFMAKNAFGLSAHLRKHINKEKEGKV